MRLHVAYSRDFPRRSAAVPRATSPQVAHWPLSSAEVAARYTVEEAYEERDAAV